MGSSVFWHDEGEALKKRAFFLDRDGVLNHSIAHRGRQRPPNKPDELRFIDGVGPAIRRLNRLGFYVFVVTNQGGVGLGYMSLSDLDQIHAKLVDHVQRSGGVIHQIKVCTHKPKADCECRKPKPGMLLELAAEYDLDLSESYMVGDRSIDIEAGKRAGTKTIFIGSEVEAPPDVDLVSPSLAQAVEVLFGFEKQS
ncbi:MAG TPA: HAD family hydrolase [Firmicutes bacterium]|nr:HAD family hydrolase [Bacillota bacterium]